MERYLPPSVLGQLGLLDTHPAPANIPTLGPLQTGLMTIPLPLQAQVQIKALRLTQLLQQRQVLAAQQHQQQQQLVLQHSAQPLLQPAAYPRQQPVRTLVVAKRTPDRRTSTGSSDLSSPPLSPEDESQTAMQASSSGAKPPSRGQKRQRDDVYSPQAKRYRASDGQRIASPRSFPPPAAGQYDKFNETILDHFNRTQQTKEKYMEKMQLRQCLYTIMKGVFPYCGLYVVGSSMNGFGFITSDMDMCLMLSQEKIDQRREAMEVLRVIHGALKKCSFVENPTVINAKVPILKFNDSVSGVECDLNINNAVGIRNTHLLTAYSRMDWRVAPLVLFVKHWARVHNINDARMGTISSYSLVLMIIHFLQCGCSPAVLPSLQQLYPEKFSGEVDVRLLTLNETISMPEGPENQESLAELFKGFLNYYVNGFDFERYAISVRLGKRLPAHLVVLNTPDNSSNQWKYIRIEEPFDCSNTARSVYDLYAFSSILRTFRQSFYLLRQSGDINSILKPF